jgi:hypothetical protein
MMLVIVALIQANVYLSSVPETPKWLLILFGLASSIAVVVREQAKPAAVKDLESGKTQ